MIKFFPKIDTPKQQRIYSKAIQFLYQREPMVVLVLPLFAGLLCYGLWDSVEKPQLIMWESAVVFLSILRYFLYRAYLSLNPKKLALPWAYYHTILSFIFGLAWVIPSYFFLEQMTEAGRSLWFIANLGNFIASAPLLSYWYPSFFAYISPYVLLITPMIYFFNIPEYQAFAFLILITTIFSSILLYYTHYFLLDSISIRFQNLKLIEQLKIEKNTAEQADQTKTRFLATASHDLRQPLYALSLYSNLLKQKLDTDPQYKLMSHLQQAELALNKLLDALLDVSKFDAGQISVKKQSVDCLAFMQQLSIEFLPQFEHKNLDFRVRLTAAHLDTDPVLLARVLRNLLKNALRYTAQGRVLFCARQRKKYIEFQIWDTGAGIAASEQKNIFEDFVQLHNAERQQQQGLGLGLAIVQRIAKLLAYPLQLKSQLNQGSVFSIQVPRSQQKPKSTAYPSQHKPPIQQLNLHILLIEDQREVLLATKLLLENWGCAVTTATDFEQIKTLLNADLTQPDVIISDYRLAPPTTGVEVINCIRQFYKHNIAALIITGDTATDQLNILTESQIPILHKPVQLIRLRTFLQRQIKPVKN